MSVNRLNFGNLAPAPSASMTRTTHSKKPHVHRCVSGCVNNFGDRTGNQRAVNILMQSLLSQYAYKELEGKPIHYSDAAFHEDFEKMGLTA